MAMASSGAWAAVNSAITLFYLPLEPRLAKILLQVSEQQQNQQDQQYGTNRSTGSIAPRPAVTPNRHRPKQSQNEHDYQDRSKRHKPPSVRAPAFFTLSLADTRSASARLIR